MKKKKRLTRKNISKSLKDYFNDVSSLNALKPQETVDLIKLYKQGEASLLPEIASGNIKLVISIAKRYTNCGVDELDLIGDGNIGLMKAVEKFDPSKGYKFSTYATYWIKQSILRGIAKHSRTIRLPLNQYELTNKVLRTRKEFIKTNKRKPEIHEIAYLTGIRKPKLKKMLETSQDTISIETYYESKDFSSTNIYETPFDEIVKNDIQLWIHKAIHILNQTEKDIIRTRFEINGTKRETLGNIGKKYNVTRERIRQIEKNALLKMKKYLLHNSTQKQDLI